MALNTSGATKSRLIFLHIPKTGGTTLVHILQRTYGGGNVLSSYNDSSLLSAEVVDLLRAGRLSRAPVFTSHLAFGIHEFVPDACTYVTLLRDPIDRTLSQYAHVMRELEAQTPGRSRPSGEAPVSLTDYVQDPAFYLDNLQTRLLAGFEAFALPFGACGRDVLEQAKHNLETRVEVAGVTERFDEFLILLRHAFGWRPSCYVRLNLGENRLRQEQLPLGVRELIQQRTEWDQELYAFARERFEAQIAAQGSDFHAELRRLRLANARYQRCITFAQMGMPRWLKRHAPSGVNLCIGTGLQKVLARI